VLPAGALQPKVVNNRSLAGARPVEAIAGLGKDRALKAAPAG
jgi:hypothetical protein